MAKNSFRWFFFLNWHCKTACFLGSCLLVWWNVGIDQVLHKCYLLFHFQKFVHGFLVGPKFGSKFGILGKCSKQIFGKYFSKFYCNYVTSFNIQTVYIDLGIFQLIKTTNIKIDNCASTWFFFWLLCLSHCVSVAVFWSLCFGRFSNHRELHGAIFVQNCCFVTKRNPFFWDYFPFPRRRRLREFVFSQYADHAGVHCIMFTKQCFVCVHDCKVDLLLTGKTAAHSN